MNERQKSAQKETANFDGRPLKVHTSYPKLVGMRNAGEVRERLAKGRMFATKWELIFSVRFVEEYLGRDDMCLGRRDNAKLRACSDLSSIGEKFIVEASYVASRARWIVRFRNISSRKSRRPSEYGPVTAYHDWDLANMRREQLNSNAVEQVQPPVRH